MFRVLSGLNRTLRGFSTYTRWERGIPELVNRNPTYCRIYTSARNGMNKKPFVEDSGENMGEFIEKLRNIVNMNDYQDDVIDHKINDHYKWRIVRNCIENDYDTIDVTHIICGYKTHEVSLLYRNKYFRQFPNVKMNSEFVKSFDEPFTPLKI